MDIYVCKMSGKFQNRSTTTITLIFEIQIFFSQLPNLIFLSTYIPTYVTYADVAKYGADHLLLLLIYNALYNSYFPSLDHTPFSRLSGWSCQLCHAVNSSPLWWLSLIVHPYTNILPNKIEKRFRIMLCIMHQVVHVWPYLKRKYLLFISIIIFKIQYR